MKVIVTRPDGFKIELEGTVEETIKALASILPPYFNLTSFQFPVDSTIGGTTTIKFK